MSSKSFSKPSKGILDLNWVLKYLKDGVYPTGLNFTEKRMIRKRAERFCYLDGDLYYLGTVKDQELGKKSRKVLLTHEEKRKKVQECHIDAEGTHLGLEKTAEGFISDFHWVGIYKFVKEFIRSCPVCIERHPKMLQSPSSFTGYGDDILDEEASLAGDDSSMSGSETGLMANTDTGETALMDEKSSSISPVRMFWEKVDLRLFGPYKFSNSNKFILTGLDGFSLWPEAFVMDTVSPAAVAHCLFKMICRYGEMCSLILSIDNEALEASLISALQIMKESLDLQIPLQKGRMRATDKAYQNVEDLIGKFVRKYPRTWPDCIDFCLLPLRISRNSEAEYTPSFLAHAREPVLPDKLTHSKGENSDIQLTAKEKLSTLDLMMSAHHVLQTSGGLKVIQKVKRSEEVVFTPPKASPINAAEQSTGSKAGHGHVTRSRTGNTKPKNDEMFETPTLKRKLGATPSPQQLIRKKVKVETVMTSTPRMDRMEEDNSDSETDLSDETSKKPVDLDTYYEAISQYVAGNGYPDKSSSSFKRLIRDQAKNYIIQDGDLYHEVGVKGTMKKIIMTTEERIQILRETYTKTTAKSQMLVMLEPVHWKGKLIDCEAFLLALHSDKHEPKTSKDYLRHLSEAKKQLQYDSMETYREIKNFIVYDVFSDDDTSKRLDYLKRQLKNFKVENDELFHVMGNKKRRIITEASNRQQVIASACQKKGPSTDLTSVFNQVSETAFWFAMKLDIKIYMSFMDSKHLLDRYFMFREHLMKEPLPERGSTEEDEAEEEEITTEENTTQTGDDQAETLVIVPPVVVAKQPAKATSPAKTRKPSGIFLSSAKDKGSTDASDPHIEDSIQTGSVSGAGDASQPQTVIPDQPLVMDSDETEDKNAAGENEIVIQIAETGETVLNEAGENVIASNAATQTLGASTGGAKDKTSDDVTVAAVKSILSVSEPKPAGDATRSMVSLENCETGQTVEIPVQPPTVADDGTETVPGQLNIEIGHESETVITEEAPIEEDRETGTVCEDEVEDSEDGLYDTDEDEDEDELYDEEDSQSDVSSFTNSSSLSITMGDEKKVSTPRQHFKCSQCDKLFFGPLRFKMHMYKHTGQKPFPCNLCSKKYTNKKSLVIHQRTHSGELPYLCSLCGKRCPSKISLKSHLKCHDGKGGGFPAKCDVCLRVFSRKHLMERHKLHKHTNAQSEFKCTECFKVFGHQRSLKRHFMSTHMGVKNHICGMCGKAFCRKEYLTGHLIQHGATEGMVRKARPSTSKPRPSVFNQQYIVKKKEATGDEEGEVKIQGAEDQMQRIFVEHDGSGNIRVLDMNMEKQVQRMLESRMTKGQVGDTMVVHIEEPSTGEPQVVHVEQTEEQVVEVPIEEQGYVEYQQIDPEKPQEYVINSSSEAVSSNTQYIYTTNQGEFAVQGNQELIYGQPAVQYEVECVGDVGDEEALSAINLLAQASAQQYETVISQI